MRRGMTLIELLTGMVLMSLLVLGTMSMLVGGLRSFQRTDSDTTMTDQNARALRKISETLRQAVSVTVSNSGRTVTYNLPKLSSAADPVTGEKEVIVPAVSDGVNHSYTVDFGTGRLTDENGKVQMRKIYSVDPDPTSSLYNQAYQPFQVSSIDTHKCLTINLIARDATTRPVRTMRMKTTAILRNVP